MTGERVTKNIVIVDDDSLVTTTLNNLLMLETDYNVEIFNAPKDAIEYICNNQTDLVVSDFLMPEMNGIEFLLEVKKINNSITTILLTGYADKENAIKAINEVGLYKYIEKPWDNDDLLMSIKNGLERNELVETIKIQREMERLRDDFIATLTHDLRTPLQAAIQTLKFFLDGTLGEINEKQAKFLETMTHSNQDMLGLVNALLEVYRYEAGQLNLCKTNFNLAELAEHCVKEIQSLAEKKNIIITIEGLKEITIYGDKQELRRVIANFLGNAITHTQKGGKIILNLDDSNNQVTLSVNDSGTGIPEADIPQMFNRFSQGTSKKRSTGTGLGLYLSRQIVEAHGGNVGLESKVGVGSKFYFQIEKTKVFV